MKFFNEQNSGMGVEEKPCQTLQIAQQFID